MRPVEPEPTVSACLQHVCPSSSSPCCAAFTVRVENPAVPEPQSLQGPVNLGPVVLIGPGLGSSLVCDVVSAVCLNKSFWREPQRL